jgi:hypothetical protein
MRVFTNPAQSQRARNLRFFATPQLWPHWPYLPLVKRLPGKVEQYGVMFSAMECCNLPGYSATVFLTNLFLIPDRLEKFLQLPREVYDTYEELADAGWSAD